MTDFLLLVLLLCLEFALRLVLEIRECRATNGMGAVNPRNPVTIVFSVLRLIPLVNDLMPLPESRRNPEEGIFVKEHETAHKTEHHAVLRNLLKIIFLLLAVWSLEVMLARFGMPLWMALLWLHLMAVPARTFFHWYCWRQEYDADAIALKMQGKQKAKVAMRNLVECEIPYTPIFALIYREHPTAVLRQKKLLNK